MYNAQTTKERIKSLCKAKKISMENMLAECSLGVNAIRQINDTKGMASFSLAKIADYLGCSVDYLLGRDTAPITNTGDVNDNGVVIGQLNGSATIRNRQEQLLNTQEQDLIRIFRTLPSMEQIKLMNYAFSLEQEFKNKRGG